MQRVHTQKSVFLASLFSSSSQTRETADVLEEEAECPPLRLFFATSILRLKGTSDFFKNAVMANAEAAHMPTPRRSWTVLRAGHLRFF